MKAEDKKLHKALNKAMEDDNFYDTILEAALAKQVKQLRAKNKRLETALKNIKEAYKDRDSFSDLHAMYLIAEQAVEEME